jgi:hypothetical protein
VTTRTPPRITYAAHTSPVRTTSTRNSAIAIIRSAVTTKKATSRPKTTALVAFWAGTTVLSRTVATTFSSVSTASVVQSATARSLPAVP